MGSDYYIQQFHNLSPSSDEEEVEQIKRLVGKGTLPYSACPILCRRRFYAEGTKVVPHDWAKANDYIIGRGSLDAWVLIVNWAVHMPA